MRRTILSSNQCIPFSALALALALATASVQATDWPQFGFDARHSGFNNVESSISAANLTQLATQYAVVLPAPVDSAPVYATGITTPSGVRNLLFLFGSSSLYDGGSSMGTVMALDSATGSVVWSHVTTGSSQHASSSVAIDPGRQHVYSFGVDGYVHKYKIGDGTEVTNGGPAGWPVQVTLKPGVEKVASGLAVVSTGSGNFLEVVTDGYNGDGGDYQGHLVSIDLGSGARKVFNFMCSNVPTLLAHGGCGAITMGGAWGRGGPSFDAASGRVFVATGNGVFTAGAAGGHHWGDSVLAFAPDGSGLGVGLPRDSYTPVNHQELAESDRDLGSTSLAILPAPAGSAVARLGVQVGKDGVLRLLNLDNLSGAGAPGHIGGELQLLSVPQGGLGLKEQPAVWSNPHDGSTWLFVASHYGISGLQLELDGAHQPRLVARWQKSGSSTSPILANGVLFSAGSCSGGGICVSARDPLTGAVSWSSPRTGEMHWQSPIVVDGAIYLADSNAKLWKFALPHQDLHIFKSGFE